MYMFLNRKFSLHFDHTTLVGKDNFSKIITTGAVHSISFHKFMQL